MSGRVDELVARLRGHVTYTYMPMTCRVAMDEAADEIERLQARIAELEATVNEWAGV